MFGNFLNPRPAQPAAQPAQQPAQPGNLPANAGNLPGDGVVPGKPDPAAPAQPKQDDSPLAGFATLWDPITTNEDPSKQPQPFALTPEAVQAAVGKMNFSQTIPAETLAAISAGGEGAQAALIAAMNQVAQTVMQNSLLASSEIAKRHLDGYSASSQATIDKAIRSSLIKTEPKSNPLLNHPAVSPMYEAAKMQLAAANPDATPQQIANMASEYVTAMAEAFAPKPVDTTREQKQDWSKFLK